MNVVQLSTYHLTGGAGIAATRLHRAMRAHGINSTLLVGISNRQEPHQPEEGVVYLANNFLANQTAFARFAAERLAFLPHERSAEVRFQFSPAAYGADISFHPMVQQADLLHLHWINFGFLSLSTLNALAMLGKPIVWTLHDQWAFTGGCHYSHTCLNYQTHCRQCPYLKNPNAHDVSFRVFEQKKALFAYPAAYTFVSPSQWLSTTVQQSALLRTASVTVIPNTLDQRVFCPVERRHALEHLNLSEPVGVLRVLFGSANLTDPRKGFRYMADALALLHTKRPDLPIEVLLFGKGRTALLDQLPYPVRLLGTLTHPDDLVAAYNAADVLVVPSLEDNLPNTIVEALSCGTPVVGFQTGGIPEMIEHRQTGFLATPRSTDELADGISWVLTHPIPKAIRIAARAFAEAHYAEKTVVESYLGVYQKRLSAVSLPR